MNRIIKGSAVALAALAISMGVAITATAQDYPTKPITVMVPFAAGGSTDLMARAATQQMSKFLDQNIVVSNRGGGAGTVGLASLARDRPDGYTLGIVPAAPLVNQPHMRRTPYNLNSFDYVCQIFSSPQVLAVKPGSPFKNLEQLVSYAKKHPGELSYGTPGPGTLPNVAMEQFLKTADIDIKHVPFTGAAPAATALQGGHIDLQLTMANVVVDRDFPAIAVFSKEPLDQLPGVQTAISQGYDMTTAWWGGMIAPKGLPENVKARLADSCRKTTESKAFMATMEKLGSTAKYRDAKNFEQYVRDVSQTNKALIEQVLK